MPTQRHLCLQLFRLKPRQDWTVPQPGLVFVFPKAGAGEYVCPASSSPRSVQPLTHGDVLVFQAGGDAKVRAAIETELAFWAFSVSFEHLYPLFVTEEISFVQRLIDNFGIARFYSATNSATIGWHQLIHDFPPEFDLEHRGQLLHLAGAILSPELRKLRPSLSRYERDNAHLTRLFEQLSADQILNLSAEELAGHVGCSPRHLNRLFHEHFGVSVGALRMEMRLLKAASLLQNPDFRIVHVAEQCAFNHLGLFNDCFKRRFGVSPGQWRKNLGADKKPALAVLTATPTCRLSGNGLCPWSEAIRQESCAAES